MELYQNTMIGLRYRGWTRSEAIAYFVKGVARELHIAPAFFLNLYQKRRLKRIKKYFNEHLKTEGEQSYFEFNGSKLPDVSISDDKMNSLMDMFEDIFLFSCYHNDNYNKSIITLLDPLMAEGPYCYTDNSFDVTIKEGDIVIDAGAWIGDFSAYASSKGATVYSFEPTSETYQWLCKTQLLNNVNGGGRIYPVQKGLSDSECEMELTISPEGSGANTCLLNKEMSNVKIVTLVKTLDSSSNRTEKIPITTIDKFVEDNKLEQVNFIKADIEGFERNMLRGAFKTLKTFAPKLSICTYHLHDDPEVLEKIIKEANPDYTIVHLKNKLFACVVS
jgi:FkbM family methyltransferase